MWLKVVLIVLGISLGASSVEAQSQCAQRSTLVARLDQLYEKLAGAGITFDGSMLEIWASTDGRWTIMVTRPNGRTCIVSHGEDWHHAATHSRSGSSTARRHRPLQHHRNGRIGPARSQAQGDGLATR